MFPQCRAAAAVKRSLNKTADLGGGRYRRSSCIEVALFLSTEKWFLNVTRLLKLPQNRREKEKKKHIFYFLPRQGDSRWVPTILQRPLWDFSCGIILQQSYFSPDCTSFWS